MIGQSALSEKDAIGTRKLVNPESDKSIEEFSDKAKNKDTEDKEVDERLAFAVQGAVSKYVDDVLGDLEIIFSFEKNRVAILDTNIMGTMENERLSWHNIGRWACDWR